MLEMLQGDSVSYILQQKHQKSAFTLYSARPGTGSEYVDTNQTRFERCTIILIKSVPVLKINNYKFLMKIRNTLTGCMCMYLVGLG